MMTKEERKTYNAAWRTANLEKSKATASAWNAANPEKLRVSHLKFQYGMSLDDFQQLLLRQKNACSICEEVFSKTPHVDHCHKTGEVRGLLCSRCNSALGGFKDSVGRLQKAILYLQKSSKQ